MTKEVQRDGCQLPDDRFKMASFIAIVIGHSTSPMRGKVIIKRCENWVLRLPILTLIQFTKT